MPGAPPLYGTWSVSIPAVMLKNVPSTWLLPPTPADAYVNVPGFAFAAAMRSLSDLNGELSLTTITCGVRTTREIGAKSVSVSKFFLARAAWPTTMLLSCPRTRV